MPETKLQTNDSTLSYLMLRTMIGVIALILPILIFIVNDFELKRSISHFYYSSASVIFTGSLVFFGLFLISYVGRKDGNYWSDNMITTIGGFIALIPAFLPTAFCEDPDCTLVIRDELSQLCNGEGLTIQYVHNDKILGNIHTISAGIFLIIMGIMSFIRFTKEVTGGKKVFFQICGIIIWLSVILMVIGIAVKIEIPNFIFYLETIALWAFGISWLVKGKPAETFPKMYKQMFGKKEAEDMVGKGL